MLKNNINIKKSQMRFLERSHKPLMWTVAILILAYAPIGRPIQKFLRDQLTAALGPGGMMLFVLALFLGGGFFFIYTSRLWRFPLTNILSTAIILLAGIGYSFSLPLPEERIHLVQFGLLGLLSCSSLRGGRTNLRRWIWRPFLFVFLVGVADEVLQWFLPDRVFDIRDILFNTLGGIWGILLYLGVTMKKERNSDYRPFKSGRDIKKYFLLFIAFFILIPATGAEDDGALELHFIDVGYGDSLLIKSPGGRYTLIDAGYPRSSEALLDYLKERKVNCLDYLIITHPHPDHLGAAVEVLNKFQVHHLRDNGQPIDQFDERLTQTIGTEYEKKFRGHPNYRALAAGDSIRWGYITLDILWPPTSLPSPDWNTNSMVIMLRYRKFRALMAADLNQRGEVELLKNEEISLQADLLKIGHHGAGDATGPEFLKAVSPQIAVISVGKNPWGYPSPVVVRRLQEAGVKVFRTDQDGSISFRYLPDKGIEITK